MRKRNECQEFERKGNKAYVRKRKVTKRVLLSVFIDLWGKNGISELGGYVLARGTPGDHHNRFFRLIFGKSRSYLTFFFFFFKFSEIFENPPDFYDMVTLRPEGPF